VDNAASITPIISTSTVDKIVNELQFGTPIPTREPTAAPTLVLSCHPDPKLCSVCPQARSSCCKAYIDNQGTDKCAECVVQKGCLPQGTTISPTASPTLAPTQLDPRLSCFESNCTACAASKTDCCSDFIQRDGSCMDCTAAYGCTLADLDLLLPVPTTSPSMSPTTSPTHGPTTETDNTSSSSLGASGGGDGGEGGGGGAIGVGANRRTGWDALDDYEKIGVYSGIIRAKMV
jgi:hypothetical protein